MQEHVFVYGTLKRGQCREQCWPVQPTCIRAAWTLGELYDTGPYPAMIAGLDPIAGELWSYTTRDIEAVLRALDEIEGTNQPGQANEYDRKLVEVFVEEASGEQSPIKAFTYFYAAPQQLSQNSRVATTHNFCNQTCAIWPAQ